MFHVITSIYTHKEDVFQNLSRVLLLISFKSSTKVRLPSQPIANLILRLNHHHHYFEQALVTQREQWSESLTLFLTSPAERSTRRTIPSLQVGLLLSLSYYRKALHQIIKENLGGTVLFFISLHFAAIIAATTAGAVFAVLGVGYCYHRCNLC